MHTYCDVFNVFADTLSFSSLYTIMKEDYQNGGQKNDDWAEASIHTISKRDQRIPLVTDQRGDRALYSCHRKQ